MFCVQFDYAKWKRYRRTTSPELGATPHGLFLDLESNLFDSFEGIF